MTHAHRALALVAAIVGAASAASCATAQQWERLGSRRVQFTAERDVIEVGAVEGRFTALRIEVAGGDLEMFNIRVVFGDGSDFSPDTRLRFRQGSRSRVIDLPGGARVVRRVSFAYRSSLRRGRATVSLFGRRAGGGGDEDALGASYGR